jgi:PST family polysaccharide transporter
MWTGGVKWLAQLISWPLMIVIARILTPADFGFVALVTVWTRLIMLLTEGGVGGAIVLGPSLSERTLYQLNSIALSLSVTAFVVACGLAVPMAKFYGSPDLVWVMIGIASTFILEGAMLIPAARLRRAMRFRELALADAARAIADSCVTLTVAMLGGRYWALVGGYGAGVLTVAVITVRLCPTSFLAPKWKDVRSTMKYASDLLLTSLTSFVYGSADLAIAGRILSAAAVGAYSFAGTLAYAPGEKLVSVLTRVTPSVFGSLGTNMTSVRDYVGKITRILAVAILPVLGGIAATAPTLVPVLLGPRWIPAIVPLQLICIHAAIVAVTGIVPQVLQSTGNARKVTQNGFLAVLVYPPAFLLFGRLWGIAGIAAAWAMVTPLLTTRLIYHMCRVIGLPSRKYFLMLLPATVSTLWMVLLVRIVGERFQATAAAGWIVLLVEVIIGIAAYLSAVMVLDRRTVREMIAHLIRALGAVRKKPIAESGMEAR